MKTSKIRIPASLLLTLILIIPSVTHPVLAQTSSNVISQLESDINDAKNAANNAVQSYTRVTQSFQEVKDTTDKLYIIALTGIGIGAAGVVIAVIALTRKTSA